MTKAWQTPIFAVATVYFIIDGVFSYVTRPVTAWLSKRKILVRLRRWITSLAPYPSFALFAVPVVILAQCLWGQGAFRPSTTSVSMSLARLVLLFGIGTRALPSWDSRTRWNNLLVCLAVRRTAGPSRHCELTSSIVPRGTSFHRSVELECPSIVLDAARFSCCCCGLFSGPAELGAVNPYAVPIAFFIPRRLAICIAQALSQDHFFDRSML